MSIRNLISFTDTYFLKTITAQIEVKASKWFILHSSTVTGGTIFTVPLSTLRVFLLFAILVDYCFQPDIDNTFSIHFNVNIEVNNCSIKSKVPKSCYRKERRAEMSKKHCILTS